MNQASLLICRVFQRYMLHLYESNDIILTYLYFCNTDDQTIDFRFFQSEVKQVEVFGDFVSLSGKSPWTEKIVCKYDSHKKCFKSSKLIKIKIGSQFKFIINHGQAYVTSTVYLTVDDDESNINNAYVPGQLMRKGFHNIQLT